MNKKIVKILFISIITVFSILSIMHIIQYGGDIIKCNGATMFLNQISNLQEKRINAMAFLEFMLITGFLYLLMIKIENDENKENTNSKERILENKENKENNKNNENCKVNIDKNLTKTEIANQKKEIKGLAIFIIIISILAAIILPNNSSDVYYYMASGRLDAKYGMNPYNAVFKDNQAQHMEDNVVATSPSLNTNFLYGSLWATICKVLSAFPVDSAIIILYIYKLANVIIHLLNCYLIYKITKKKRDVLIYAINPLIIFEALINCHNDIYVVFFILLAIYLKKQKKIKLAVASIALGALIKYIPILLLPYIILDEDIKKIDIKKTALYILEAILIFFGISIVVIGNVQGVLTFMQQTEVLANSLYLVLRGASLPVTLIHKVGMVAFIVIYIISILKSNQSKTYVTILTLFLLLVISNFRTWYIMWLFALIPVVDNKDKKYIITLSIVAEISNIIMYRFGESYIYGTYYFITLFSIMIIYALAQKFEIVKKLKGKINEKTFIN